MKIKKAVIPAAGLGTRFLPATKSVPKEMLTIVDAPIIFYVVEEAINAGIEDIILIQGRGKTAIEDFFDTSYELEDKLQKDKKYHLLDRLSKIRNMANIISIRQKQPLGLGHAVLCAEPIVGKQPFAVLLGDEIMLPKGTANLNALGQLCQQFEALQAPTVAVMKITDQEVSKYGIADFETENTQFPKRVTGFIEKPKPESIKSRWALPGRYTFTSEIFEELRNSKPGALGELQLTDAMNALAKKSPFFAYATHTHRYDAGDKLGYLIANIELALRHPELRDPLKEYLENNLKKILN